MSFQGQIYGHRVKKKLPENLRHFIRTLSRERGGMAKIARELGTAVITLEILYGGGGVSPQISDKIRDRLQPLYDAQVNAKTG